MCHLVFLKYVFQASHVICVEIVCIYIYIPFWYLNFDLILEIVIFIFLIAASCPPPLVFHDCFQRECEPNCNGMKDRNQCPSMPGTCIPGCFCPDGLVRKGDKCVKPIECRDCECDSLLCPVSFILSTSSVCFTCYSDQEYHHKFITFPVAVWKATCEFHQ